MCKTKMFRIDIATDSSGDFTVNTPVTSGKVVQVRYVVDGTSPLVTGADLTITAETSGVQIAAHSNIGTTSFTRVYKQATHGVDGSASLYAAPGEPVEDYVYVAQESLTVTIAEGGDTKVGTLYIYVAE